MAIADLTIRGAGIFGLSIAYSCARRGAKVRVVDPGGIAAGASGGIVGALAPHVPELWNAKKAFQFDSLLMAETFWAEIADRSGLSPGYGRTGRLQPVADAQALSLARQREASAAELWQGRASWKVIRAEEAGSWAPASPSGWLVHDTLTARIHPRRACEALAKALKTLGCEFLNEAPQSGPEIWATGAAGLQDLSAKLERPVGMPIKGQAALLQLDQAEAPQLFVEGVHVVPHQDGTVAIGSTTEREYQDLTTDTQLDEVIATARAAIPALAHAPVILRWAGLRPRAKSRAPMLGEHPLRPDTWIANGGFKIGFGMAPKIAEIMADLTLEARDTIPTEFKIEASL